MLTLSNSTLNLTCEESGAGLIIHDTHRGAHWCLDPHSQVWTPPAQNIWGSPAQALQAYRPLAARQVDPAHLIITCQAGEICFEIHYYLREDFLEIVLPPVADLDYVSLPGSFQPEGERLKLLLPIMQGMLWDGRGPAFNLMRSEAGHLGFTMAFSAYLGERGALLLTAETRDDCRWWLGKDDSARTWAANLQIASLGSLRYERRVRIYLTDPDIVAVAKCYRRKVGQQGNLKTWEEKIAERPALERLFGALMCFIGYCQEDGLDYVESCRKLQAYGFDRAFLYPNRFNIYYSDIHMGGVPAINLPRETVEAIKALGYDIAPWSWLNEALQISSPEVLRGLRRASSGQPIPHWAIDDQQWYLMCYSFIADFQRTALQNSIPEVTWDHFDVLSCVSPMECYALDHPQHLGRPANRSEDREWVRAAFREDTRMGLMVSSENFNDAYIRDQDFGSVKAWPQYGPWPFWPVPLTMLVYHDCMIHSWWELHSYNNPWRGRTSHCSGLFEYGGGRPRLMAAMDALMGCPPDVFAFGAQYGYTGHAKDTFLYQYRFEDPAVQMALQAALPVARLHRRIGKQEMVHFKILSEDGYVQESAFADGTRIVANFSRDFAGSVPGVDHRLVSGIAPLEPEGWRRVE